MERCYLDQNGNSLASGNDPKSFYRIETNQGEQQLSYKQGSRYILCFSGSPEEVQTYLQRHTAPEAQNTVPAVVECLLPYVSHLPGMTAEHLESYLFLAVTRNRDAQNPPLINTRLCTRDGTAIYVIDNGGSLHNLSCIRVVHSLAKACECTPDGLPERLPPPLQWCTDMRDCIWDPTAEVLHISDASMQHMLEARRDRLPASLSQLKDDVLLRFIHSSVVSGAERASRDFSYALPSYSRKGKTVNMLLPLRVFTSDTELPEAVLLLVKTPYGYRPTTIITLEQAYESVRLFRDPEYTWLRGLYT